MRNLYSAIIWSYFVGIAAVTWAGTGLVTALRGRGDPQRRRAHRLAAGAARHLIDINRGWSLTIEGLEHVDPDATYVIVPNHQSFIDILAIFATGLQFKFVSKHTVFRAPFVGGVMRRAGYIELVRGDKASIRQMLEDCRDWLRRGVSVVVFAEGTRSKDRRLKPFKPGAFLLSRDLDLPVLPIVIDGTDHILPKDGIKLAYHADVRLRILPPVSPGGFGSLEEMRDAIRGQIIEQLAELRNADPADVAVAVNADGTSAETSPAGRRDGAIDTAPQEATRSA